MHGLIKAILNRLSQLLVLPLAIVCKLEEVLLPRESEVFFNICTQSVALIPGLPGVFLRRGFYSLTLESCSLDCFIGFGTIFSHRATTVESHVYIGSYAIIGSATLGKHCLIGSRASILSGTALHVLDDDGMWTPYSSDRLSRVTLENNVWIGEGAIVAADVSEGVMVGAGAVVTTSIKPYVIVAGNPARFVRNLIDKEKGSGSD